MRKQIKHKLNKIKLMLLEIELNLKKFEATVIKKRGRPSSEATQQAHISILKILNEYSGLTISEVFFKLGNIYNLQFKKTTRKRMGKLEIDGKIKAINKDPLRGIQRNVKYIITERGMEKLRIKND